MKLLRTVSKSVVLSLLSFLIVAGVIYAATTIGTDILTTGTLSVTGLSSLGNATTTALTSSGPVWISGDTSLATASSTGLVKVSSLKANDGSSISGLIFGSCTIAAIDVTTATTTYSTCAGVGDVANVTSSYRVFVSATSSPMANIIVAAASSTATTGTLGLRLHADAGAAAIAANTATLSVWAVR